jgi:GntR family transcriptional regulator, transcriptional repressor for pyruvate dehydrogenase complex
MRAQHGRSQDTRTDRARRAPGSAAMSRVEEAYRGILGMIMDGALVDGDRLPSEPEMATTLGISRPVVRQALGRLQQAGIVDVRWGAGSFVRDAAGARRGDPAFGPVRSLEEVRLTYEFRCAIEGDAAALAAERRLAGPLGAARRALDKLDQALARGEIALAPDLDFHFAIATASGNPFFERVLRTIQKPLEFSVSLTRTLALSHPNERRLNVMSEHTAILDAIEAGKPAAARETMRLHLQNSCRRLFQGPDAAE